MIVAGLLLLTVGAIDLVRQFVPRRWIGYLVVLLILMVLGSVSNALLPMIVAVLVGALWIWSMPDDRGTAWSFWPAIGLAFVSAGSAFWIGERADQGLIADVWSLRSPFGELSFDVVILVLGVFVFLLESGNLVVRAALSGENTWRPEDGRVIAVDAEGEPAPNRNGFKGGRLIGPLERVLVAMLTLTGAYAILAAMLAAKGIVRFPEISKDGETGARAEYFLVGSLVSWVTALAAAFLVWWALHS